MWLSFWYEVDHIRHINKQSRGGSRRPFRGIEPPSGNQPRFAGKIFEFDYWYISMPKPIGGSSQPRLTIGAVPSGNLIVCDWKWPPVYISWVFPTKAGGSFQFAMSVTTRGYAPRHIRSFTTRRAAEFWESRNFSAWKHWGIPPVAMLVRNSWILLGDGSFFLLHIGYLIGHQGKSEGNYLTTIKHELWCRCVLILHQSLELASRVSDKDWIMMDELRPESWAIGRNDHGTMGDHLRCSNVQNPSKTCVGKKNKHTKNDRLSGASGIPRFDFKKNVDAAPARYHQTRTQLVEFCWCSYRNSTRKKPGWYSLTIACLYIYIYRYIYIYICM